MKKAKIITFWIGFSIFVLNQILVFALLNDVRNYLEISHGAKYWSCLFQYIIVIIGLVIFAGYTTCILYKKPITNQVGAIIGTIYIVFVILFSWLVVTWIFWAVNLLACALLFAANTMILKLNRENM